jgi:hypothetical protein
MATDSRSYTDLYSNAYSLGNTLANEKLVGDIMKQFLVYVIIICIVIGVLTYFFGEMGLLSGILGSLGLTSGKLSDLKDKAIQLDKKAAEKQKELDDIQKKKEKLKKDGVKDMTPEEVKEYWKNQ